MKILKGNEPKMQELLWERKERVLFCCFLTPAPLPRREKHYAFGIILPKEKVDLACLHTVPSCFLECSSVCNTHFGFWLPLLCLIFTFSIILIFQNTKECLLSNSHSVYGRYRHSCTLDLTQYLGKICEKHYRHCFGLGKKTERFK